MHLYSYLVDVSPVPVVLQAFPQHRHDLIAGHHIVGQVGDVGHLGAGRSPGVVRGCFSHLQLKHKLAIKTKPFKLHRYFPSEQSNNDM